VLLLVLLWLPTTAADVSVAAPCGAVRGPGLHADVTSIAGNSDSTLRAATVLLLLARAAAVAAAAAVAGAAGATVA
jgi:hypothetical protein